VIDIIIPTLGRPHRIAEVVDNITKATSAAHRIVFVCEAHDADSIAAVKALDLEPVLNSRTRNYQGAVNTAYHATDGEWLFCGADDLNFRPWWHAECLQETGRVIGTNDLYNAYVLKGWHSTHSLVRRSYLDELGGVVDEGPGSFLAECFDHNFCDTEFIATAKMRGEFRPCLSAIVEHLHPAAGKAEIDATYQRSMAEFDRDARMFDMRKSLWADLVR
jgi:glycosyltransferase involved in cell wall biosynthesis